MSDPTQSSENERRAPWDYEKRVIERMAAQDAEIERLRAQCASLAEALRIFTAAIDVWWEKDDKVVVSVHRSDYAFAAEVAATSTDSPLEQE